VFALYVVPHVNNRLVGELQADPAGRNSAGIAAHELKEILRSGERALKQELVLTREEMHCGIRRHIVTRGSELVEKPLFSLGQRPVEACPLVVWPFVRSLPVPGQGGPGGQLHRALSTLVAEGAGEMLALHMAHHLRL
jgi:hypothetical protein